MRAPDEMPRVVIGHDFAEAYGGAERVVAAMAARFEDAPVKAILGRKEVAVRMGVADRFESLLPPRPWLLRNYRLLTPAFPPMVRRWRLPAADVLLTSSYAFAHGFRTENLAPQVCFCHSPLRFAWSMEDAYEAQLARGPATALAFRGLAAAMRRADRRAARQVTRYLASSRYTAAIIERAYGVRAEVLYPPIDTAAFSPSAGGEHEGFYLFCSRLVEPYKRASLAIEAFRDFGAPLIIAGDGPAYAQLSATAPPNVSFVGALDQAALGDLMRRCAAVIFPSRDDFGLVPVEAAASGRPTIAYGSGGALETVIPGVTGELFPDQTAESLLATLVTFDPDSYEREAMVEHAASFGVARFQDALERVVVAVAAGEEEDGVAPAAG